MKPKPLLPSLLLTLAVASPAVAHDFWIEPSSLRPAVGERVGIALRVGQELVGEPVPRRSNRIVRFDQIDPGGVVRPLDGLAGADPAGLFLPVAPGLHWALYQGNRAVLQLEAAKFSAYLREEGLERIVDERAALGESDRAGRETYSRSALAALCARGEGALAGAVGPFGLTLELVPESDPCSWRAGDEIAVRLLFRGKPLAGARFEALHAERLEDRPAGRTDDQGWIRIRLDQPGRWLLKAVQMERALAIPEIEWESFWASLRFELDPKR